MTMAAVARSACAAVVAHAEELTAHTPMPGGIVVVADAGGLLAEGKFGYADIERRIRTEPGHAFEIGSISKIFTGLLVDQLIDEGVISLETRATEVLPWLRLGAYAELVTVRHLLNHSAGLIGGVDALTDDVDQVWALRDLATSPPGTTFHYSNVGYVLLGLMIAELTGVPYPRNVQDRLLTPMGMSGAIACVTNADRGRLATGYQPAADDRPWVPGDLLAPAPWFEVAAADGNIAATGADMAGLIRCLLDPDAMTRIITTLSPGGEPVLNVPGCPRVDSSRYGLGVNVEMIEGHECLTHGGGMVGYSSFLLVDRTAGVGTAVLTNANGNFTTSQALARLVHARATVHGPGADFPAVSTLVIATDDASAPPLGRFLTAAGVGGAGELEVVRDPASGRVEVSRDGITAPLYRVGPRRFVTDHPRLRRFHLEASAVGRLGWTHGPDAYRPAGETEEGLAGLEHEVPATWQAMTGHYRSYSPWYPHLRIYARGGRLWLAAPGGVEAPDAEEELVDLADGSFRIGAESANPERLRVGPVVDGRAVSVVRDGCRYSRTFTD